MPRPPRDAAAGTFHVFTHCVWAVPTHFRDGIDRVDFLRRLAHITASSGWTCLAFCLMNSHYHLIVEVADGVLPTAMQRLNLGYAITYNHRHELRGTTQSHRYGARRITDDADLVGAFAYVVKNPVRAGACDAPESWPWSSYAGTIGVAPQSTFVDDGRLLRCFELPGVDPRAALRAYVDAGVTKA